MLLNRKELCEACGVSDSTISSWEKKGMPVVRKGRGRGQKSVYDFDKVRAWCDQTGHGLGINALIEGRGRPQDEQPPRPSSALVELDLARAIALARVECVADLPGWEFSAEPRELADCLGLYVGCVVRQLRSIGLARAASVLDAESELAWPNTFPEILDRARAEVPAARG